MSHALLAIQNILQNSNIFIGSRETVLFAPFGKKKLTQFSGLPPTSVSYLNFMSHSIKSNYKLYVITYYRYIIVKITNLKWMAWSEKYQIVQDQYKKSWNFSVFGWMKQFF